MNGKEAFVQMKDFTKENGLRVALGASLALNGAAVVDASVNNGEGIKSIVHFGGEMVNSYLEEICFYPEYEAAHPEECEGNGDPFSNPMFDMWG